MFTGQAINTNTVTGQVNGGFPQPTLINPPDRLRGYLRLLLELPVSAARNALAFEFLTLADRLDDFIQRGNNERIQEREQKREQLWAEARLKEDQCKILRAEVAHLSMKQNEAGFRVGEARAKVMEATGSRPTETRFPTKEELDAYQQRCQQAADDHYQVEASLAEINRFLASSREATAKAEGELRDMVDNLSLLDGELARLRQYGELTARPKLIHE